MNVSAHPPQSAESPFSRADHPRLAFARMAAKLAVADCCTLPADQAAGLISAQPVVADRPSPPFDASAVDGYAVCRAALKRAGGTLPISGCSSGMGQPPPVFSSDHAVAVATGGAVPAGADAVIPVENVCVSADAITLRPEAAIPESGGNIRGKGENARTGDTIVPAGRVLLPPATAALAAFGHTRITVHRPLNITLIVTGDELSSTNVAAVSPWRIRDSNGPALTAAIQAVKWLKLLRSGRVADNPHTLLSALTTALADSRCVILTGGVSVGTRDFTRQAVEAAGGIVQFHRLPIKPGRPVMGAVGPQGQCLLGLPGNPASAQILFRALVLPMLAVQAGGGNSPAADAMVHLSTPAESLKSMYWFRPVRRLTPDRVQLIPGRGSGDIPMMADSDGFVEIAPEAAGTGPYPFYSWSAV